MAGSVTLAVSTKGPGFDSSSFYKSMPFFSLRIEEMKRMQKNEPKLCCHMGESLHTHSTALKQLFTHKFMLELLTLRPELVYCEGSCPSPIHFRDCCFSFSASLVSNF